MFDIKGNVAIITGPRSGIGQAIAVAMAKSGVNIMGVGTKAMPETKALVEAEGARFAEMQVDLMQPSVELFDNIVKTTVDVFGKIDILVNNAGLRRRGACLDYSMSDWDAVMNVNLKSLFFLTQRVGAQFLEQGSGGKVVNVASLLSFQGGFRTPAYASSKSAVAGLTKSFANEWAGQGINVNAVAPGYITTEGTAALREDKVRNEQILVRIPAGRWGDPDDIAGPVVFLCSPAARYIHGTILQVDGGWLGR